MKLKLSEQIQDSKHHTLQDIISIISENLELEHQIPPQFFEPVVNYFLYLPRPAAIGPFPRNLQGLDAYLEGLELLLKDSFYLHLLQKGMLSLMPTQGETSKKITKPGDFYLHVDAADNATLAVKAFFWPYHDGSQVFNLYNPYLTEKFSSSVNLVNFLKNPKAPIDRTQCDAYLSEFHTALFDYTRFISRNYFKMDTTPLLVTQSLRPIVGYFLYDSLGMKTDEEFLQYQHIFQKYPKGKDGLVLYLDKLKTLLLDPFFQHLFTKGYLTLWPRDLAKRQVTQPGELCLHVDINQQTSNLYVTLILCQLDKKGNPQLMYFPDTSPNLEMFLQALLQDLQNPIHPRYKDYLPQEQSTKKRKLGDDYPIDNKQGYRNESYYPRAEKPSEVLPQFTGPLVDPRYPNLALNQKPSQNKKQAVIGQNQNFQVNLEFNKETSEALVELRRKLQVKGVNLGRVPDNVFVSLSPIVGYFLRGNPGIEPYPVEKLQPFKKGKEGLQRYLNALCNLLMDPVYRRLFETGDLTLIPKEEAAKTVCEERQICLRVAVIPETTILFVAATILPLNEEGIKHVLTIASHGNGDSLTNFLSDDHVDFAVDKQQRDLLYAKIQNIVKAQEEEEKQKLSKMLTDSKHSETRVICEYLNKKLKEELGPLAGYFEWIVSSNFIALRGPSCNYTNPGKYSPNIDGYKLSLGDFMLDFSKNAKVENCSKPTENHRYNRVAVLREDHKHGSYYGPIDQDRLRNAVIQELHKEYRNTNWGKGPASFAVNPNVKFLSNNNNNNQVDPLVNRANKKTLENDVINKELSKQTDRYNQDKNDFVKIIQEIALQQSEKRAYLAYPSYFEFKGTKEAQKAFAVFSFNRLDKKMFHILANISSYLLIVIVQQFTDKAFSIRNSEDGNDKKRERIIENFDKLETYLNALPSPDGKWVDKLNQELSREVKTQKWAQHFHQVLPNKACTFDTLREYVKKASDDEFNDMQKTIECIIDYLYEDDSVLNKVYQLDKGTDFHDKYLSHRDRQTWLSSKFVDAKDITINIPVELLSKCNARLQNTFNLQAQKVESMEIEQPKTLRSSNRK